MDRRSVGRTSGRPAAALRWAVRASAALTAALACALLWTPNAAVACSAPPESLPPADVVAEGWIERVTLRPDLATGSGLTDRTGADLFVPVEVALRGARVLRGSAPLPLTFLDMAGVSRQAPHAADGSLLFIGASGACGVLDRDETGRYAVVALSWASDGRLHSNRLLGFTAAASPHDAPVQVARRAALHLLPAAGALDTGVGVVGTPARVGAALVGAALVALGGLVRCGVRRGAAFWADPRCDGFHRA